MKRLLTILILLLGFTTAHAQVELFPEQDKSTNFYFEANEQAFGAGFQYLGITSGASHMTKFGEKGLFVDTRITPTLANVFGVDVIGGVGGSAGYLTDNRKTKTNWSAIYGLRYKSIELTQSHVFHYGDDYMIPVTLRWYLD